MTARPFLITGLPRSRTAWLSVLFTTGRALCLHEPLEQLCDITDLADLYRTDAYTHMGVSDSILGFFLPWIMENIKPRTIIVERDPDDVAESLHTLGLPPTTLPYLLHRELQAFKGHPLVKWVRFEQLDSPRVVQQCFFHVLPGEAFDEDRYRLLSNMNIVTDLRKAQAKHALHSERIGYMLRDVIARVQPLERPSHARIPS